MCKHCCDFVLQYFEHVEEAEWAVHVLKETGKPVAASLCIGPMGDMHGVTPGECAIRLVKAGTLVVFYFSSLLLLFKNSIHQHKGTNLSRLNNYSTCDLLMTWLSHGLNYDLSFISLFEMMNDNEAVQLKNYTIIPPNVKQGISSVVDFYSSCPHNHSFK